MGLDPIHQRGFGPRENEVYGILDGKLNQRWEIANVDIEVGDIRKVVGGPAVSCKSQFNSTQFSTAQHSHLQRNCVSRRDAWTHQEQHRHA